MHVLAKDVTCSSVENGQIELVFEDAHAASKVAAQLEHGSLIAGVRPPRAAAAPSAARTNE